MSKQSNIPRQLICAQKLGDAMHERFLLSADVQGMEVEVARIDKDMREIHNALYEVLTDGLDTTSGGAWLGIILSMQDIQHMSFFCDDSLNVRGLEIVDNANNARMFHSGGAEDLGVFNEVALFVVEGVLKEYEYL